MWRRRFRRVVLRREGVAVALWGEAGIGKTYAATRLLQELPCRSLGVHATVPLTALVRPLPRSPSLPSWASSTLAQLDEGVPVPQERVVEAVVAAMAASAPFVLHLEDLHEADGERVDLVAALGAAVRRTPGAGALVTSRGEPPPGFERVRLEPLPRDEIARVLGAELGAEPPAGASRWITDRAHGNPLFALEYLRYLSRQGYLWSDGRRWHWRTPDRDAIPPSVEALLEVALEGPRRDGRLEDVMAARALLPVGVAKDLWARVADVDPAALEAASLELERRGVFSQGDFAHPLYREVLVQGLDLPTRRRLARRAIAALDEAPLELLPVLADADLDDGEVLEILDRTVAAARASGESVLAAHLLAAASERSSGEARGRRALAAAQAFSGVDFRRMHELALRAEAHLTDELEVSEARFQQARALATGGRHDAMRQVLARLSPTYTAGAAWLERYADLLHRAGRQRELIEFWEAQPDRDGASAVTVYRVGWAYVHGGDLAAASRLVADARARQPPREAVASIAELEAVVAFYSGRYADAERLFGEVLAAAGDDDLEVANALRNRAVVRMQLARYVESLPDLERALEIYARTGHGVHHAQTLVMTSYVHVETGAFDRAEDALLEAIDTFRRTDPQPGLIDALAQATDLYLRWSDAPNAVLARRYALEAMAVASSLGEGYHDLIARASLARARIAIGQPQEGLTLAEPVVAGARRAGYAEVEVGGMTIRAEALDALGRRSEALAAYAEALARAEAIGMPLEVQKIGLEIDRREGAAERLETRMVWFEERALAALAELARRYLGELVRAVPRDAGAAARPLSARGTTERAGGPRLEVLGPMRLHQGDHLQPVRGPKTRLLLALLLEARITGRSEPSRLDLVDAIYPGQDELKAVNSLKQLVRSVRTELGPTAVRTTSAGYLLGELGSDAERFLDTHDTTLWRGRYLEGVEEASGGTVADVVYRELAAAVAALLPDDPAEAARAASILCEADPYDPGHLRLALAALRDSGNLRTLQQLYRRARARFAELGEHLPESWSSFLAPSVTG
jgi:tetratricopeptide (TPR) repeat protein